MPLRHVYFNLYLLLIEIISKNSICRFNYDVFIVNLCLVLDNELNDLINSSLRKCK